MARKEALLVFSYYHFYDVLQEIDIATRYYTSSTI